MLWRELQHKEKIFKIPEFKQIEVFGKFQTFTKKSYYVYKIYTIPTRPLVPPCELTVRAFCTIIFHVLIIAETRNHQATA